MFERRVRIIKRDQRGAAEQTPPAAEGNGRGAERAMRAVVSEWVREHAWRAEEYQRGYGSLLRELGFR
jgi:hypothetical protein